MPEPSCPGLASAAVLKGPQTGGFGVRKLSDPFSPPGSPPLFHYENSVERRSTRHFMLSTRLNCGRGVRLMRWR
jgi:hypothetical protein